MSNPHRIHACASELQTRLDQLEKDQSNGQKRVRYLRRLSQCQALIFMLPLVCTLFYLGLRYISFEFGYQEHLENALLTKNLETARFELEAAEDYINNADLPFSNVDSSEDGVYLRWVQKNLRRTIRGLTVRPTYTFSVFIPIELMNQSIYSPQGELRLRDVSADTQRYLIPGEIHEAQCEAAHYGDTISLNGNLTEWFSTWLVKYPSDKHDPDYHWDLVDGYLYRRYGTAFVSTNGRYEKCFRFVLQREMPMDIEFMNTLLDDMRMNISHPPAYMNVPEHLWIYPYKRGVAWMLSGSLALLMTSIGVLIWIKRTFLQP